MIEIAVSSKESPPDMISLFLEFVLIFDNGTGWFLDFHFLNAIIGMQISMMQTQMIATIQVVLKRKCLPSNSFIPPNYLHLIFAILQFEILSLMNWIFLSAVACKVQALNGLNIQLIKLDISNCRIVKIKFR